MRYQAAPRSDERATYDFPGLSSRGGCAVERKNENGAETCAVVATQSTPQSFPPRSEPRPIPERLRDLAKSVRRIGSGYRSDPEHIALAKDHVEKGLIAIARELEP